MAIVQISQIQVRRGLNQDLPQLAGGEMGWSVDTQQLYIGNGTIAEGAPETGVTEILTQYSMLEFTLNFSSNLANLAANVSTLSNTVANVSPTTYSLSLNASSSGNIYTASTSTAVIKYYLNQNGAQERVGTLKMARLGSTVNYTDDYTETGTSDIVFSFINAGGTAANLYYTTTTATTITFTPSLY